MKQKAQNSETEHPLKHKKPKIIHWQSNKEESNVLQMANIGDSNSIYSFAKYEEKKTFEHKPMKFQYRIFNRY